MSPLAKKDMRLRLPQSDLVVPAHLVLQIEPGTYRGKLFWFVQEATTLDGTLVLIPEGRNTRDAILVLEGVIQALKDQANNPIPLRVSVITEGVN